MKPNASELTFISLFAGIGGFDLGMERAGWRCVGQVEINPFCRAVLDRHWPEIPKHGDIRTFDESVWSQWEKPLAIVGGYPCQPFSRAGMQRGAVTDGFSWD